MGFAYPHGYDTKKLRYMYRLDHFSVKFKGKENYSVGYGSGLGKTDKGWWMKNEGPINNLELAYAISVHKSQGSEFGTVYLVLFIQKDISALSCLAKIERSAVRRINSSVFKFEPLPEQLSYLPGYYEEYKVIATLADYFVRSKSEALIANALHASGLDFSYEKPFFGTSNVGKTVTGEKLAVKLDYTFIDMDKEIKKRFQMSLEEFMQKNPYAFERSKVKGKVLKDLIEEHKDNIVIAVSPIWYARNFNSLFNQVYELEQLLHI